MEGKASVKESVYPGSLWPQLLVSGDHCYFWYVKDIFPKRIFMACCMWENTVQMALSEVTVPQVISSLWANQFCIFCLNFFRSIPLHSFLVYSRMMPSLVSQRMSTFLHCFLYLFALPKRTEEITRDSPGNIWVFFII